MTGEWYEGFKKFADGRNWTACTTGQQLLGWTAAQRGQAACQVMDSMAEAGADGQDMDVFLSSIEDDHEWIRRGC
jgi:hypothetical protein